MMDARRIDRLLQRHAVIDDIDDDLEHCRDDSGSARRAHDENRLAVFEHECWRHGTQGTFPGGNCVGFALHQAKNIGHAGLGGEVVHLIIQEESGIAGDHLGEVVRRTDQRVVLGQSEALAQQVGD